MITAELNGTIRIDGVPANVIVSRARKRGIITTYEDRRPGYRKVFEAAIAKGLIKPQSNGKATDN